MKKKMTALPAAILPLLLAALLAAACENMGSAGPDEAPEYDPFRDLPVVAGIEGAVTGMLYQEAMDAEIVITLTDGKRFTSEKAQPTGTDLSSWFSVDFASLGLAARTKKVIAKNGTKATIGISGIPVKTLEKTALVAAIPAELLADGEAGRTADSEDVFVEIAPSVPAAGATPICTAAELASIGADGGLPLNGAYYLENDIDLSGYGEWSIIGRITGTDTWTYRPFTGVLDGAGHKITGFKPPNNPPKYITNAGPGQPTIQLSALFGYVSGATIKNLTVELAEDRQMEVAGASYHEFRLAVLAGLVNSGVTIAGVTVKGTFNVKYNASYYDNQLEIGGLFSVSSMESGSLPIVITGCRAEVDMNIETKGSVLAGGFASKVGHPYTSIMFSQARGGIKADSIPAGATLGGVYYDYGGFASQIKGTLSSCTADVDISVKNILPSFDTASGYNKKTYPYICMGGFAAWNSASTVQGCTSSGNILYQINTLALPPAEEYVDEFIGVITGSSSLNIDSASGGTGTVVRTTYTYE